MSGLCLLSDSLAQLSFIPSALFRSSLVSLPRLCFSRFPAEVLYHTRIESRCRGSREGGGRTCWGTSRGALGQKGHVGLITCMDGRWTAAVAACTDDGERGAWFFHRAHLKLEILLVLLPPPYGKVLGVGGRLGDGKILNVAGDGRGVAEGQITPSRIRAVQYLIFSSPLGPRAGKTKRMNARSRCRRASVAFLNRRISPFLGFSFCSTHCEHLEMRIFSVAAHSLNVPNGMCRCGSMQCARG